MAAIHECDSDTEREMESILESLNAEFKTFAVLKMAFKTPELTEKYRDYICNHNMSLFTDKFVNSGFDLFFPENVKFGDVIESKMVNFQVKCEMRIYNFTTNKWTPTGYYMYPRSSLSKTPLILSNHVGIIDSGYRGNLMGAFRIIDLSWESYIVEKNTRLLQVCAPDLRPIVVRIVDESFFQETERGAGGFGSTGI
jgi:dUTP pyrophosphatase